MQDRLHLPKVNPGSWREIYKQSDVAGAARYVAAEGQKVFLPAGGASILHKKETAHVPKAGEKIQRGGSSRGMPLCRR